MLASRRKIKILRSLVSLLKLILTFFVKIIFKIRSNKYSVYISEAFYSPWTDDMDFNVIFLRIKEFTMLDKVRLYNIWSLIENIKKRFKVKLESQKVCLSQKTQCSTRKTQNQAMVATCKTEKKWK